MTRLKSGLAALIYGLLGVLLGQLVPKSFGRPDGTSKPELPNTQKLWLGTIAASAPPLIAMAFSVLGTIAAFLTRLLTVRRFRQPLSGALLLSLGVCALVAVQWVAFSLVSPTANGLKGAHLFDRSASPMKVIL